MTNTHFDVAVDAGQSSLRLSDAGAQTVIEQFRGSTLVAEGKVNILALDAIAERMGPRWPVRRELVHEHAQRVLRGRLGAQAIVQRVSETEFLVVQAEVSAAAARFACLNGLREILTHFLGQASDADISIRQVTRIDDDGIYGRKLTPEEMTGEEPAGAAPAGSNEDVKARTSFDVWTPFTTSTGLQLALSASLEPLVALKNGARIGFRVAARIHNQAGLAELHPRDYDRLSASDLTRIDLGAVARGLDQLLSTNTGQKPATLLLPVSYGTLQSRAGRATLITLLRQARSFVEIGLIVEVNHIEGAPASGLQEAIGALRPLTLHVIGRVADIGRQDLRHLTGAGLGGVSALCPSASDDAEFRHVVRQYVKGNVAAVRGAVFLYQAPNMDRARLAAEVGVTHVTLAPQNLKMQFLKDAGPRVAMA